MLHCGLWDWYIVGFATCVYWTLMTKTKEKFESMHETFYRLENACHVVQASRRRCFAALLICTDQRLRHYDDCVCPDAN